MTAPNGEIKGLISNIQYWTVHDGPGVRTEVFFKGCPMSCKWCSNPETINPYKEVGIDFNKCIGCGTCITNCKHNAITFENDKVGVLDRSICKDCKTYDCASGCPVNALSMYGQEMTVDEIVKLIRKERAMHIKTGGGITLSGGDCMYQPEFCLLLLKECDRQRIHTCVETELMCSQESLNGILPYTDLMITDIKHMDSGAHRKYTGVGNKQILSNIRFVTLKGTPLVVRIPVVTGVNDSRENIDATARFLLEVNRGSLKQLQVLPYRPLGLEKYKALNRKYEMEEKSKESDPGKYLQQVRDIVECLREYGLPAEAGTGKRIQI